MKHFNIGNPKDWVLMEAGHVHKFDAPHAKGGRKLRFDVNSYGPCAVELSDEPEFKFPVLLGSFEGMAELRATVEGTAYVRIISGEDVCVRTYDRDHMVKPVGQESFTTVIPRGRRNTEFDRIAMLVKLNNARNEAQIAAVLAKNAELQQQIADAESVIDETEATAGDETTQQQEADQGETTSSTSDTATPTVE